MAMHSLTLFLPGLLGPMPAFAALPAGELPDLSCLENLLGRAEHHAAAVAPGVEAGLFSLFDIPPAPDADPPVAAVTRLLDGGEPDARWWLRADPVYLQADTDSAVLLAHDELRLTPAEAAQLAGEIQAVFGEDGWQLQALHPARWYLTLPAAPRLRTHALGEVLGRNVRPFLPAGEDGRLWHRHLNEIQMLLHASAVNAEREASGRLPVNSLWFWGGGTLPPKPAGRRSSWAGVWADEPLAQGLAALSGATFSALPSDGQDWLRGESVPGEHLLYVDDLRAPAASADPFEWVGALEAVQARWLVPLHRALQTGRLAELVLLAGDGGCYRVRRGGRWRSWLPRRWRHRPLSAYLGDRA
ncbi:MAG TPA: hypothetical protein VKA50_04790 [Gammaproteobacteria bacterium]|nr:hypothetical protein [Gammaproteobacteria bacterium]